MIRIYKNDNAPESLSKRTSWKGEDVIRLLHTDQNGKCYLCERFLTTDFQVEHHKSRGHFPELTYEWSNLFCCCSYCNSKKSASFDDLLNPADDNIEELIHQSFDFPNAKVLFSNAGGDSPQTDATIALLCRIFNGTNRIRTLREQRFYDFAMSRITSFQGMVITWIKTGSDESEKAIIEELDICSEFLGFKYWIIRSNEALFEKFGKYVIWHK